MKYNLTRADLLEQIAAADKDDQRENWIRQVADCYSTAAQSGAKNNTPTTSWSPCATEWPRRAGQPARRLYRLPRNVHRLRRQTVGRRSRTRLGNFKRNGETS